MKPPVYVLVTPVRNEESTIQITIESVIHQTILPAEWVIVSDASTDRTDEIVRQYVERHPFIRLLRLENRPQRSFASVVFVTQAGIGSLTTRNYDFIGLLDADVRFKPDYFEQLQSKFRDNPQLGVAGGLVGDIVDGNPQKERFYPTEVAGATQFFRRACFESICGLIAIPEGGWDAITCLCARMRGYTTQTFRELSVDHLKPRNSAEGGVVRRKWQMGERDYALGNHPIFEMLKCCYRINEAPVCLGAMARACGYFMSLLSKRKRIISKELVRAVRFEQIGRIRQALHWRAADAQNKKNS